MTEYVVKADFLVTADTEEEAVEEFRRRVQQVEASAFEVELWDGQS